MVENPVQSVASIKSFPIYLFGGKRGSFKVPDEMTAEDLDLLRSQMDHNMGIIAKTCLPRAPVGGKGSDDGGADS